MKTGRVVLALGVVVGGGFAMAALLRKVFPTPEKPVAPRPVVAGIVPSVNPNVDYTKPVINVGIATGYNDVAIKPTTVNLDHIGTDYSFQYQGYIR